MANPDRYGPVNYYAPVGNSGAPPPNGMRINQNQRAQNDGHLNQIPQQMYQAQHQLSPLPQYQSTNQYGQNQAPTQPQNSYHNQQYLQALHNQNLYLHQQFQQAPHYQNSYGQQQFQQAPQFQNNFGQHFQPGPQYQNNYVQHQNPQPLQPQNGYLQGGQYQQVPQVYFQGHQGQGLAQPQGSHFSTQTEAIPQPGERSGSKKRRGNHSGRGNQNAKARGGRNHSGRGQNNGKARGGRNHSGRGNQNAKARGGRRRRQESEHESDDLADHGIPNDTHRVPKPPRQNPASSQPNHSQAEPNYRPSTYVPPSTGTSSTTPGPTDDTAPTDAPVEPSSQPTPAPASPAPPVPSAFEEAMSELNEEVKETKAIWETTKTTVSKTYHDKAVTFVREAALALQSYESLWNSSSNPEEFDVARQAMNDFLNGNTLHKLSGEKVVEIEAQLGRIWDEYQTVAKDVGPEEWAKFDTLGEEFQVSRRNAKVVVETDFPAACGMMVKTFKEAYLNLFRFQVKPWQPESQEQYLSTWQPTHDALLAMLDLQRSGLEQYHHLPTLDELQDAIK